MKLTGKNEEERHEEWDDGERAAAGAEAAHTRHKSKSSCVRRHNVSCCRRCCHMRPHQGIAQACKQGAPAEPHSGRCNSCAPGGTGARRDMKRPTKMRAAKCKGGARRAATVSQVTIDRRIEDGKPHDDGKEDDDEYGDGKDPAPTTQPGDKAAILFHSRFAVTTHPATKTDTNQSTQKPLRCRNHYFGARTRVRRCT